MKKSPWPAVQALSIAAIALLLYVLTTFGVLQYVSLLSAMTPGEESYGACDPTIEEC